MIKPRLAAGAVAIAGASLLGLMTASPAGASSAGSIYRFINWGTGDCLDAGALYGDPDDVYSVKCNSATDPTRPHQQWVVTPSSPSGTYMLRNVAMNKCLAALDSDADGVQLRVCGSDHINQKWYIQNNQLRDYPKGQVIYDEAGTTDIRLAYNPINPYNNGRWTQTGP